MKSDGKVFNLFEKGTLAIKGRRTPASNEQWEMLISL